MNYLGDFVEDETVYIPFNTFDSNDPAASVTVTDLISTDVEIWKDGVIQTTPGAGVTITLNIGTNNGSHLIAVDTSNTTDAGFYVTGADYQVRINGATVDAGTINAWVGSFSIQNRYMRGTDSALLAASVNTANGAVESDLTYIHGSALTETAGQLAAAFVKLFDVATPTLVASDVMRGTDGANTVTPPTEAQMNARTLPSADYLIESDTLARVTLVDTVTTNTDVTALDKKVDRNADLVESQRGAHTWQGNYYYVDPVNGDTHANGNRGGRLDPYLTIQDCHDNAVTDSNHDVIFLVAGNPSGVTTHTVATTTTLSKRYTFLRGPGRDFIITRSGNGDTIAITGDGIEISGVQIGTAATGSGDGIQITDTDFTRIHNCWFLATQGDGIQITRGSNSQILNNHFEGTGVGASGEGIHIDGTGVGNSIDNVIRGNHFADCGGDAILIENGTIIDTSIENNVIHGSGGWGINIAADSTDAIVSNNVLGNNTSGDIQDNGTTSILFNNEQIQDQVWDEILTAATHNIATSSGRRLRDIASPVVITGTSPGGGGNQSVILDGDASAVDGTYDPSVILITGGAGAGQSRQVMEYVGATKTAYVKRDWKVNPDATSTYTILASAGDTHINEGLAQAGGATSITLNALASSVDDTYVDQTVFIVSGTGQDQARNISAYNGTTKVATVLAWETQPDATSVYIMLPNVVSKIGLALSPAGVDAIWAKAMQDLAQGAPSATASVFTAINYLYMAWRNKVTSTDTLQILHRDDGVEELTRTVISDDDTTFTKAEKTTGQ